MEPTNKQTSSEAPADGFSSAALKWVAIVAMTCNHAGYIYYTHLPLAARTVLIAIGGLTFPIMAYLLVEGYTHTSSLKHYAGRLGVFAIVAQLPFWFFLGHEGNVLFTLLAGLGVLWASEHIEQPVLRLVAMLGLAFATIKCDWGVVGPVLVYAFYVLRPVREGVAVAMLVPILCGFASCIGPFVQAVSEGSWRNLPFLCYYVLGNTAAIPLLMNYNGTRGTHSLKWFFYIYYPAHIAILGVIYLGVFGTLPPLIIG